MNKILVGMLSIVSVSCSAFPISTQLFFHRGVGVDQLVFYSTNKPHVECSTKKIERRGHVFIQDSVKLIGCRILPEQLQRVAGLQESNDYHVRFDTNNNDIVMEITYDPECIRSSINTFTSIQQNAGVAAILEKKNAPHRRRTLARTIVIDCGHGGHDCGALGVNDICEKTTTLEVGLCLALQLRSQGYQVFMTRVDDEFVPLDERTHLANQRYKADLFISLHVNSAPRQSVVGVETFFTQGAVFTPALTWSTVKDVGSQRLARLVQRGIMETVNPHYSIVDRGCKCSASHVMLGNEMPTALVELGFNSNPEEAARLGMREYQQLIAAGIANGIDAYLKTDF